MANILWHHILGIFKVPKVMLLSIKDELIINGVPSYKMRKRHAKQFHYVYLRPFGRKIILNEQIT